MNNNLEYAINILTNENLTFALYDGKELITSRERGIKPLLNLYESERNFKNFSAADKVIGKAAAFMYALLGIKEIFSFVISEKALEVFEKYGIDIKYEECSPNIINRTKTDICPMEKAVLNISSAKEAYKAICAKLTNLKNG